MKLILCDLNPEVTAALAAAFAETGVQVVTGNILSHSGEAILSPANSFGWMDGGIDLPYRNLFGYSLEVRLQFLIAEQFDGELPVGQAVAVRTVHPQFKWLISAPTMRTPGQIRGTDNVFQAFKAALICAKKSGVMELFSPGMGTLTGGLEPQDAAGQMLRAWREFSLMPPVAFAPLMKAECTKCGPECNNPNHAVHAVPISPQPTGVELVHVYERIYGPLRECPGEHSIFSESAAGTGVSLHGLCCHLGCIPYYCNRGHIHLLDLEPVTGCHTHSITGGKNDA